ncbi:hypothetical protein QEV68_04310 [Trueperella pyogenes]|uniref:hypothetical protein n=1 Tax=Trueperella pyogenes TaxID=1661 RepID=UPI00324D663C
MKDFMTARQAVTILAQMIDGTHPYSSDSARNCLDTITHALGLNDDFGARELADKLEANRKLTARAQEINTGHDLLHDIEVQVDELTRELRLKAKKPFRLRYSRKNLRYAIKILFELIELTAKATVLNAQSIDELAKSVDQTRKNLDDTVIENSAIRVGLVQVNDGIPSLDD